MSENKKIITRGNIVVQDIKIGDIQFEYEWNIGVKSEVITLPTRDENGVWRWQNKIVSNGNIINYCVTENLEHYGPNLYDCEAYSVNILIS